eukprot:s1378_g13.t1
MTDADAFLDRQGLLLAFAGIRSVLQGHAVLHWRGVTAMLFCTAEASGWLCCFALVRAPNAFLDRQGLLLAFAGIRSVLQGHAVLHWRGVTAMLFCTGEASGWAPNAFLDRQGLLLAFVGIRSVLQGYAALHWAPNAFLDRQGLLLAFAGIRSVFQGYAALHWLLAFAGIRSVLQGHAVLHWQGVTAMLFCTVEASGWWQSKKHSCSKLANLRAPHAFLDRQGLLLAFAGIRSVLEGHAVLHWRGVTAMLFCTGEASGWWQSKKYIGGQNWQMMFPQDPKCSLRAPNASLDRQGLLLAFAGIRSVLQGHAVLHW